MTFVFLFIKGEIAIGRIIPMYVNEPRVIYYSFMYTRVGHSKKYKSYLYLNGAVAWGKALHYFCL